METVLVYFDESGDDGFLNSQSRAFILTSLYMKSEFWQKNYLAIKNCRTLLKEKFGFHSVQEMHTMHFLCDKNPYREYNWTKEQRREILKIYAECIAEQIEAKIVNVIIDKRRISNSDYPILKNALKYNIQRIENDSEKKWNYLIIADKGRIAPMRKTARAIRAYNPIRSHFFGNTNQPITGLVEDILEKESCESHFIQICDFVSYFVNLYYKCIANCEPLPGRAANLIDNNFVKGILQMLKKSGRLNLKASSSNEFGFVIYPKR